MSKRVLGPGASCCGEKDCDLGCNAVPSSAPLADVAEPIEDLDPFDEEDDE